MSKNDLQDSSITPDISLEKEENLEVNTSPSNGLENFNFDEETPELFNSVGSINKIDDDTSSTSEFDETKDEEEDLEIPAFLRRQKN